MESQSKKEGVYTDEAIDCVIAMAARYTGYPETDDTPTWPATLSEKEANSIVQQLFGGSEWEDKNELALRFMENQLEAEDVTDHRGIAEEVLASITSDEVWP
jgi:hypothetical protein